MLKLAGEIIISVLRICFVLHRLSDEALKQRNGCTWAEHLISGLFFFPGNYNT
jgi:hypothetical protein